MNDEKQTQLNLDEELVVAWVRMSNLIKNSRLTNGMSYNEAMVMLIVYLRYKRDGEGLVSFPDLLGETHMLKSHLHRTIASLAERNLLERVKGSDRRTIFVRPVKDNLDAFLKVHACSLSYAEEIRSVIGDEDILTFLRIVDKLYREQSEILKG